MIKLITFVSLLVSGSNLLAQLPDSTISQLAKYNCNCYDKISETLPYDKLNNEIKNCYLNSLIALSNKHYLSIETLSSQEEINKIWEKTSSKLVNCEKLKSLLK